MFVLTIAFTFVSIVSCEISSDIHEPVCTSKFDYDYKMLKQMVMLDTELMEIRKILEMLKTEIKETQQAGLLTQSVAKDTSAKLRQIEESLTQEGSGATFVRWGKTTCPGNGSELVYKGFGGGSHYSDKGAGSTYLCLTEEPTWKVYDDAEDSGATVWGLEYEFSNITAQKHFRKNLHDQDVPCCVCHTKRASVLLIPGRDVCFDGWNLEYRGYLVGGHTSHHASEFVCLDEIPEEIEGGAKNHNGKLFFFSEARCGALKCPPYVNGRELTCAVCSK